MPTPLPYIEESSEVKRALNASERAVREATLRQASDIATAVYHAWKRQLNGAGVTWQSFQSAASANHEAWRNWLNGELSWRGALEELVKQLNKKAPHAIFALES